MCAFVAAIALAPALHAADASHATALAALRALMRQMDEYVHERTETELELDKQRLARAGELAALARRLAAEAAALAPATSADAAGRARFVDNAHALADEAAELARVAEEGRYAELSPRLERLGHRCAACHVEFRPAPRP